MKIYLVMMTSLLI